jgi:hypothetical protein
MNSIDLFVKNWGSKSTMVPINGDDIAELEEKLNVFLPESYKYLLATYGLVHTPNVLTRICDLGSDVAEVQDFLSLDDVFSLSKLYEMGGMPKGHTLFASDCKGNMFCFKLSNDDSKSADLPVWFFDHDACTVKQISPSFSEWLAAFNKL